MFDPLSAEQSARVNLLGQVFARIGEERMKDIGLYNHALGVEVIGFRPWQDWVAGVLVTPWFMNFMLLPNRAEQMDGIAVGVKRRLEMPCGEVILTAGEVEEIGFYWASSLYSPMGRFDVHDMAVTTARAAVEKFFHEPELEEPGGPIKA